MIYIYTYKYLKVHISELKSKISRMKDKRKEKDREYQSDFEDLQNAAKLMSIKESEFNHKATSLEKEKDELVRAMASMQTSENRKSEELMAIVKEYHHFKEFVSSNMVEAYQLEILEEQNRRDFVPLSEFHHLSEKLNSLRSECRLNLVSKEEFESVKNERDSALYEKKACEEEIKGYKLEKLRSGEVLTEKKVHMEALEAQLQAAKELNEKQRVDNARMHSRMEGLEEVRKVLIPIFQI